MPVTTHPRCWARHRQVIDPAHAQDLWPQRPAARFAQIEAAFLNRYGEIGRAFYVGLGTKTERLEQQLHTILRLETTATPEQIRVALAQATAATTFDAAAAYSLYRRAPPRGRRACRVPPASTSTCRRGTCTRTMRSRGRREMPGKELSYLLRRLQLSVVEATLPAFYTQAKVENWSYEQFLQGALETAATTREERGLERRVRQAGFPSTTKTLGSYDFTAQPDLKKAVVLHLATMEFVRNKEVAILLGPTGAGKSHLSIALGLKACQAGFSVRFTTALDVITTLTHAHREHHLEATLRQYTYPALLICDELGYIPFDPDAAALFFQLISRRYETASMIVSSNLPFSSWRDVFGNATAASAIIDRLVHHAEILVLKGSSYRLRGKEQVLSRDRT